MKKTATLTILAAMVMMTALSCTKELNGVVDKAGDTMSLTVNATLPDYADATKNTLVNTIRVNWENDDKVYVYDNEKCLGTLTATVGDGEGKTALLSGEISTSTATKLTLVAMTDDITPSVKDKDDSISGGITFDLSGQNLAGAPYVAFATVDTQSGTVSNLSATFTFATSVERVNCTGLKASTAIDSVIITGVNTQLTITPSASGNPEVVAAKGKGTIIRKSADGFSGVNANGATTFSVALLQQSAASRSISAVQSNWVNEAKFTNGSALNSGLSYNTVCQLSSDYVLIKAKYNGTDSTTLKWYKQNLAITASGKKAWKGRNESAVKVPGTNGEEVIVGDYFQWAASYKGYNVQAGKEKLDSLLIYTAFTNTGCGESEDKFTFRSAGEGKTYQFNTDDEGNNIGISPYLSGSAYTKYNDLDKNTKSILDTTSTSNDDVASIILGGDWRMPTSAEFKAMKDATYWAWDGTDKGYYVFAPDGSHAAGTRVNSIPAGLNKESALLFFPAAGSCYKTSLDNAGNRGRYWSSSLYTSDTIHAYNLNFNFSTGNFNLENYNFRCSGGSVRPVSD